MSQNTFLKNIFQFQYALSFWSAIIPTIIGIILFLGFLYYTFFVSDIDKGGKETRQYTQLVYIQPSDSTKLWVEWHSKSKITIKRFRQDSISLFTDSRDRIAQDIKESITDNVQYINYLKNIVIDNRPRRYYPAYIAIQQKDHPDTPSWYIIRK